LGAVLLYFRQDTVRLFAGLGKLCRGRVDADGRLFLLLAWATIPVVIVAGVLVVFGLLDGIRQPVVIACATIGFALPLWFADRFFQADKAAENIGYWDYLLLGIAQACAVIPGTSRAGVTMTAGRALGLSRQDAAHISMLMSIPTILVFGGYTGFDLYRAGALSFTGDIAIATALSFATALLSIWGLMAWLRRADFTPFVIYRLVLGVALLIWIYA
jgi:undecaprenyl-diphosphatase